MKAIKNATQMQRVLANETLQTPWLDVAGPDLADLVETHLQSTKTELPEDAADWLDANLGDSIGQVRFAADAVAMMIGREIYNDVLQRAKTSIGYDAKCKLAETDDAKAALQSELDAEIESTEPMSLEDAWKTFAFPVPGQWYKLDIVAGDRSRACGMGGPIRAPMGKGDPVCPFVIPFRKRDAKASVPRPKIRKLKLGQ